MANELQQVLNNIKKDKDTNLLPANLKDGVTCLGIEGTLENKVKLFETVKEMQADSSSQEGDLAVVYRNEIQNMTADVETQYITFPETVTLPEAFTDSFRGMLRPIDTSSMFDGQIQLRKTRFTFDGYSESGRIMVQYNSSDGITYTRTRFSGGSVELTNPVDLGTIVKYESIESWNDALGYFMLVGGMKFDGLYEYLIGGVKDVLQTILISNISFNTDTKTVTWNNKYGGPVFDYNKIATLKQTIDDERPESIVTDDVNRHYYFAVGEDNNPYIFAIISKDATRHNTFGSSAGGVLPFFDVNGNIIGTGCSGNNVDGYRLWTYKLNLNDMTYDEPVIYAPQGEQSKCYWDFRLKTVAFEPNVEYNGHHDWILDNIGITYMGTGTSSAFYYTKFDGTLYTDGYTIAPNQYTLQSANQLLPGKIAYGKNGVVTGDNSIYSNLDKNEIYKNVYGLKTVFSDNSKSIYSLDDDLHISTCNDDTKIHKFKIDNTSTTDSIGLHNVVLGYNELLKNVPEKYINNYRRVGNYNDVNNNKSYIIYQSENTPTTIDLLSFDTYESEPVITNLPFELPWDDVITKFEWNDSYLIYNVYTNAYTPDTWYFGKVDLTNLTVQKITTFAQPSPYTNTTMIDFTLSEDLVVFLCRTNYKANLENKYDLAVFNCSTNTLHTLLSDLTTKYTQGFSEYGRYHIFNFENHAYITFTVEWNGKHHTIYKMYKLENDQVTTVVDDSGTYNWNEPTAYSNRDCSSFCIEDDDKVVDIKNGYIAYKTIANPGVKDTKLNDTSLSNYTWISNREYFLTENNKKIMYQVDEEPNITITEDNITFNAIKKLAIPLYFSSIAQNAPEDTTISFSSFKYKYTDKLVATNTSYLQIDTYTFIPGIFTDGNVYDYAVLNTVVSDTDTANKANCIILAKTLGSNYTGTISPTEYITAVDTTEQILGRRKQ